MFLCAYFNLRLSSLRVFFMKKMMDAISSITGCSFQVPSTENSPDFWGNGMKSDFSVALESGKVVKDSLPSLPVSREMPGEMHAGTGRAAAFPVWLRGWRTKGLLRVNLHL